MTEIHYSETAAKSLHGKVVVLTGTVPNSFQGPSEVSVFTRLLKNLKKTNHGHFTSGGAQGVGAAAVNLYHSFGAHVYFGDWDDVRGRQVEQRLKSKSSTGGTVHFQKLDVRDYQSQLRLFDVPFKEHGRIDVAVSCAAVKEDGGWFEPESLDLETVKKVGFSVTE